MRVPPPLIASLKPRAARAGLVVLAAVLLTGCTDGRGPTRTSTVSTVSTASTASRSTASTATAPTSASATPTPTQTGPLTTGPNVRPGEKPPELPRDLRDHTTSGALAAAFYFFKALDWSIATNNAWSLRQLSSPDCKPCNATIEEFDGLARLQRKLVGGRITITSWGIASGHFNVKADEVVRVASAQSRQQIFDVGGSAIKTFQARDDVSLVFLNWIHDTWSVVDLGTSK